jgi:hypothetical protein
LHPVFISNKLKRVNEQDFIANGGLNVCEER